jgi:hypothetical protein
MVKAAKAKVKVWKSTPLLTSAIRKLWMRSPMRAEALRLACVNPSSPVKQRLYKCAICGKNEIIHNVHVDHIEANKTKETWDEFIARILLSVSSVTGQSVIMMDGSIATLSYIVYDNLQVVDDGCHKQKSKIEAAQRKERRKLK